MIKIDKNIPMPREPKGSGGVRRKPIYPWADMSVGDSFFAPGRTPGGIHGPASLKGKAKFERRTVEENGVSGCRVWRTE